MHRRSVHRDYESLLSERDMDHLRHTLGDAHEYIQSARDPDPTETGVGLGMLEIVAAASVDGYLSARYEDIFHPKGFPVPLDAIAALGGLYAAYRGVPGAGHIARGSIGVLSAVGFKFGAGMGTRGRLSAGLQPVAITAGREPSPTSKMGCGDPRRGYLPPAPPRTSTLTEAEMAAISRSY